MTPDKHLEIRTNTGDVLGIELKSSLNGIGEDCRPSEVTLQKEIPPHDGASPVLKSQELPARCPESRVDSLIRLRRQSKETRQGIS